MLFYYNYNKLGDGCKTITGLLRSRGISVSEARVGTSLRRVDPTHHLHRSRVADYFGHKLHITRTRSYSCLE